MKPVHFVSQGGAFTGKQSGRRASTLPTALKSDPLSECQEELAKEKNQKTFADLDLQKASPDVKYNLIIEKLDLSEENFKKFKKDFEEIKKQIDAQLNTTNGELNNIRAQLNITNGKLNDIREEIWPVVRAEAISLAVQVLVVFSGGQPQNPPLPLFVPIWMKDKKCKTILEKVMGLKTDRKSTCSSQRSCSI